MVILAFGVTSLIASVPLAARADEGEWALSLGPAYRVYSDDLAGTRHSLGLSVGAHYALDDFWQLGGTVEGAYTVAPSLVAQAEDPTGLSGMVRADIRWLVDVLTWVPFVEVSVGVAIRGRNDPPDATSSPSTARLDLVTLVSIGLDYRPERDWSLGVRGGVGWLLTDLSRAGALTRLDLMAIFHFD